MHCKSNLSLKHKVPVDIIVVTRNAKANLKRCLNSVLKNTEGWDFLITIIDNGSSDGTKEYLKDDSLRGIKILSFDKNVGLAKAINVGVKNTHRDLIVLLDDDCEVTPGWRNFSASLTSNGLHNYF